MGGSTGAGLEEDRFIGYPVKLERWLMEGSYDRVWAATKREGVPGEEFGVFSEVGGSVLTWSDEGTLLLTEILQGAYRHDPLGNRILLRKSLPVSPHRQREESAFPGERRQRRGFCTGQGLGREGWQDILPIAAGRRHEE